MKDEELKQLIEEKFDILVGSAELDEEIFLHSYNSSVQFDWIRVFSLIRCDESREKDDEFLGCQKIADKLDLPFNYVYTIFELFLGEGWLDYGTSLHGPWLTEEGEKVRKDLKKEGFIK